VLVRPARRGDLAAIVGLFADDELNVPLEPTSDGPNGGYREAFDAIEGDPDNCVYVAELGQSVMGTFQLTFIRQLSHGGCLVAQVESGHVHSTVRSAGIGAAMLSWAIAEARRRGCIRVQLTSNLKRLRAHQFYERLGFRATHKGMKLFLAP